MNRELRKQIRYTLINNNVTKDDENSYSVHHHVGYKILEITHDTYRNKYMLFINNEYIFGNHKWLFNVFAKKYELNENRQLKKKQQEIKRSREIMATEYLKQQNIKIK